MWHGMDRNMAMKVWHWPFLAQPEPLPEMLISKAPPRMEDGELDQEQEPVSL
jgi:haloacetate dehalogenase